MKAASLESNGKIKIIEKSIPNIEPDECLIKVVKCGNNYTNSHYNYYISLTFFPIEQSIIYWVIFFSLNNLKYFFLPLCAIFFLSLSFFL